MSLVSQEIVLFDDTVRANIAYGRMDASEDDIARAAKMAAADSFISELPQGYDTIIGPHGVKLSGGQRQRLAIARAMLKNAPILLLDEATSSLDNTSERIVQQALENLMEGRTTLVVAHRLTTIRGADIIYVLDRGRIAESGTHEKLMQKSGVYHELYAQIEAHAPA
jgi:ATP-binding cassette, subfamily B, bacterial MsbA